MRIAILGNSGSGKSTLAQWLAARAGAALLDLDTVAWEPGKIAVARAPGEAQAAVRRFCSGNGEWVIEGCYASLVGVALESGPRLIFLNPGKAQCLANCRARPWEAHKYQSKEEQDERLAFLLKWVGEYYTRDGDMSLKEHRRCFDEYGGEKLELRHQPELNPPSAGLVGWLKGSRERGAGTASEQ